MFPRRDELDATRRQLFEELGLIAQGCCWSRRQVAIAAFDSKLDARMRPQYADSLRNSRFARVLTGDLCSLLTRQPEPPALVLNEPSCYHFRVLDPRVSPILSATIAAVIIGHCYHSRAWLRGRGVAVRRAHSSRHALVTPTYVVG